MARLASDEEKEATRPAFPRKALLEWLAHLGATLARIMGNAWRSIRSLPPEKRNVVLAIAGMMGLLMLGGAGIGFIFSSVGLGIAYAALVTAVWLTVVLIAGSSLLPLLAGARRANEEEAPEMIAAIGRLSDAAGIPAPSLWISSVSEMNAFACGRSSRNAAVVVTQGGIDAWDSEETRGILAHEIAHIKNRDVLTETLMYAIANGIRWSALLVMKPMEWTIQFFGGFLEGDGWWSSLSGFIVLVYGVLFRILDFVFGVLLFPLSILAQRVASRQQEYLADKTALELSGGRNGLAKALAKILVDEREANGWAMAVSAKNSGSQLWATHPPTAKRIQRLGEDPEELARTAATALASMEHDAVDASSELVTAEAAKPAMTKKSENSRSHLGRCIRLSFDLAGLERGDAEAVQLASELEEHANALLADEATPMSERAEILNMRGSARVHRGLLKEAERDIREALKLSPKLSSSDDGNILLVLSAYKDLSWIAEENGVDASGLWSQAVEHFEAHFRGVPGDTYCVATAYANLAFELCTPRHKEAGGLVRAAECAERAVEIGGRPVFAHCAAGLVYHDAYDGGGVEADRSKAIYHYEACLASPSSGDESFQEAARTGLAALG